MANVRIVSNGTSITVEGANIEEIRSLYADVLNISEDAQPFVNGEEAGDDYDLQDDDELTFSKPAGQKG